jgi:hypothetical protein
MKLKQRLLVGIEVISHPAANSTVLLILFISMVGLGLKLETLAALLGTYAVVMLILSIIGGRLSKDL